MWFSQSVQLVSPHYFSPSPELKRGIRYTPWTRDNIGKQCCTAYKQYRIYCLHSRCATYSGVQHIRCCMQKNLLPVFRFCPGYDRSSHPACRKLIMVSSKMIMSLLLWEHRNGTAWLLTPHFVDWSKEKIGHYIEYQSCT